jgi:SAM-dependent methyltransferase
VSEGLLPNYRKPVGEAGKVAIEKMYAGHAGITAALMEVLRPGKGDVALDVGCGGGLALSLFAKRGAKAYGVDYSEVSVEKATGFNRDAVRAGGVVVLRSDVLAMPFADEMFTIATAIETVYFWDRVEECYARIFRTLKPGGRFAILADAWRDGDRIVNEPERMDVLRLNLYSPEEFAAALETAGFAHVDSGEIADNRCLCVVARK